jgi:antitoxin component YwqK of YwqJK toxin-antitoxin module
MKFRKSYLLFGICCLVFLQQFYRHFEFYAPEIVMIETEYIDSQKHGFEVQYYPDGYKRSVSVFKHGYRDGYYCSFYPTALWSSQLDDSISFLKRLQNDEELREKVIWNQFLFKGACIRTEGFYEQGLQSGKWMSYNQQTIITGVRHYAKGKLHGEVVLYKYDSLEAKNQCMFRGNYLHGLAEGLQCIYALNGDSSLQYYHSGLLDSARKYEQGKLVSLHYYSYYKNGQKRMETDVRLSGSFAIAYDTSGVAGNVIQSPAIPTYQWDMLKKYGVSSDQETFNTYDVPAKYPGGEAQLKKDIQRDLQKEFQVQGILPPVKLLLRLLIESNGHVSKVHALKSTPIECRAVVKSMAWHLSVFVPATLKGVPVASYVMVEVEV